MQETTWIDEKGRENFRREFFTGKTKEELTEKLRNAYNAAVEELPGIVQITQTQLDLNGNCPCGKNKSFKKCCYWKLLQDPPVPIARYMK